MARSDVTVKRTPSVLKTSFSSLLLNVYKKKKNDVVQGGKTQGRVARLFKNFCQ